MLLCIVGILLLVYYINAPPPPRYYGRQRDSSLMEYWGPVLWYVVFLLEAFFSSYG